MFSGDESIRFKTADPKGDVYDHIEDALSTLGRVEVDKRGRIDIYPRSSLGNALVTTTIDGSVRERDGEYTVFVEYTCTLSTLGWVIFVLGILFLLIGLLVLIAPMTSKGSVAQASRRALRGIDY